MSVLLELNKNPELHRKLSKSLEEAVFTVAILKKLKVADLSTLTKRIVCQKLIYFSNRLEISPNYGFSLYVHGPYSPALANDLFALVDSFDKIPSAEFISNETVHKFEKLERLMVLTKGDARTLEIAATLDLFIRAGKSREDAKLDTIKMKSAKIEEVESAEKILEEIGLLG